MDQPCSLRSAPHLSLLSARQLNHRQMDDDQSLPNCVTKPDQFCRRSLRGPACKCGSATSVFQENWLSVYAANLAVASCLTHPSFLVLIPFRELGFFGLGIRKPARRRSSPGLNSLSGIGIFRTQGINRRTVQTKPNQTVLIPFRELGFFGRKDR